MTFSQISSTLEELELTHVIDNPQPFSASSLKTLFRLNLNEKYTNLWQNETQTSGLWSIYRKCKKELKLELYLVGGGEIAQSLASLSIKRAIQVRARHDPLVTERWNSITVLLTRSLQCRRLVKKGRPCVIMSM